MIQNKFEFFLRLFNISYPVYYDPNQFEKSFYHENKYSELDLKQILDHLFIEKSHFISSLKHFFSGIIITLF